MGLRTVLFYSIVQCLLILTFLNNELVAFSFVVVTHEGKTISADQLFTAIYFDRPDDVQIIMNISDITKSDLDEGLHIATEINNLRMVDLLIKLGADVNNTDSEQNTPLHKTTDRRKERIAVAELLIQNGADINAKGENNYTALDFAVQNGYENITEFFIKNGADINSKNKYGETPLHIATFDGNEKIAELLIEHGADINARKLNGYTPLHLALEFKQTNMVVFLIEHECNVNAIDNLEKTALHIAAEHGHSKEIAELLIKKGANINAVDKNKETPLFVAAAWSKVAK